MVTLEEVRKALPVGSRGAMNQAIVDQLNSLSADPESARVIRENFLTYTEVLMGSRYKVGDYTSAIMYTSYKMMGKSNHQAYVLTFPDRYRRMEEVGKSSSDIASMISTYNKGQLVIKIMERAVIPSWLLNQDMFQLALQTQCDLMTDMSVSNKVRSDAANSLLSHLKRPTVNKAELSITIDKSDGMAELEATMRRVSKKQLELISDDSEISAADIAAMPMKVINPA